MLMVPQVDAMTQKTMGPMACFACLKLQCKLTRTTNLAQRTALLASSDTWTDDFHM